MIVTKISYVVEYLLPDKFQVYIFNSTLRHGHLFQFPGLRFDSMERLLFLSFVIK
jgi:hypothetical protein